MTLNAMEQYLEIAAKLERFVHLWQNALADTENSIKRLDGYKRNVQANIVLKECEYSSVEQNVKEEREKSKKDKNFNYLLIPCGVLFILLAYGVPILMSGYDVAQDKGISFWDGVISHIKINMGFLGIAGILVIALIYIVGIIISLSSAIILFRKREKSRYWDKLSQDRKGKLLKEKDNLYSAISVIDTKRKNIGLVKNQIIANLQSVRQELSMLYGKGVLPEKYRNMVAVTTMYEYLHTKRCNMIEGHGGIYDTYEKDYQQGLIIKNLIEINSKLDVVISNQQILHREMSVVNSQLRDIRTDISNIEKHTANIEQSSAVSAAANMQMAAILQSRYWRS